MEGTHHALMVLEEEQVELGLEIVLFFDEGVVACSCAASGFLVYGCGLGARLH